MLCGVIATVLLAPTVRAAESEPLVFVGDAKYPPMTYLEGGQAKGVTIDIVRELEKRMGRRIEIRLMDWQQAQDMVAQGKADALCQMSITEAREQTYDFTDPVHELRFSIFVRTGKIVGSTIGDLRGLQVGVTAGGLPRKLVEADPGIHVTLIDDYVQGFAMLKDRKLDAVIADQWVGAYILADKGISDVQPSGNPVARLPSAFAVKRGNASLLATLNDGLRSLRADGTIDRINAAWAPKEVIIQTREQAMRTVYVVVIGLLLLALVVTTVWVVTVRRKIAECRRAEAEVHRLNTELEQRVQDRTAELQAANKELEAFSYSVSHDLRSPLRAIAGFSRIIQDEYVENVPAEAARMLKIIETTISQMGRQIDDLLAFSRLGRQALSVRNVAPAGLVREVVEQVQAAERGGRRVDVSIGELAECKADPSLLRHVYVNLISNAFKYSRGRDPATIEIGCHPGETAAERVYFVKDNGSGFDMRYAGKLFGVFQRLHRDEEYEGTGVGLAIVQRIVNRHGGRVWAEAAVDRGATFYFTLRGGDESRARVEQPAMPAAGTNGRGVDAKDGRGVVGGREAVRAT